MSFSRVVSFLCIQTGLLTYGVFADETSCMFRVTTSDVHSTYPSGEVVEKPVTTARFYLQEVTSRKESATCKEMIGSTVWVNLSKDQSVVKSQKAQLAFESRSEEGSSSKQIIWTFID